MELKVDVFGGDETGGQVFSSGNTKRSFSSSSCFWTWICCDEDEDEEEGGDEEEDERGKTQGSSMEEKEIMEIAW